MTKKIRIVLVLWILAALPACTTLDESLSSKEGDASMNEQLILQANVPCLKVQRHVCDPANQTRVYTTNDVLAGTWMEIFSREQLQQVANINSNNFNGNIVLCRDIDYQNSYTQYPYRLNGVFDGNFHRIKNVLIDNPNSFDEGFFSQVYGTVKNLVLENIHIINGPYTTGGLASSVYSGAVVENVLVTGAIELKPSSSFGDPIGGVVGWAGGATLRHLEFRGSILDTSGGYSTIGGVVGKTIDSPLSYGEASVTIEMGNNLSNYPSDYVNVGGLVGNASSDWIEWSFAKGSISVGEQKQNLLAGGLVGYRGKIRNSYSSVDISTARLHEPFSFDAYGVGGLSSSAEKIERSFSVGTISIEKSKMGYLKGGLHGSFVSTKESFTTVRGRIASLSVDTHLPAATGVSGIGDRVLYLHDASDPACPFGACAGLPVDAAVIDSFADNQAVEDWQYSANQWKKGSIPSENTIPTAGYLPACLTKAPSEKLDHK